MEDPQVLSSAPPPPPAISAGLADNVAGALAYITIIPAILFLILEPYNRRPFVRFHSLQCIGLAICSLVFSAVMVVPVLGWIVGIVGHLSVLVFWIISIIKAYQGVKYKVPVIGDFVEKTANS
jgi:uncharacterized membrane protein